MILEADIHEAIDNFIGKHNKHPKLIKADYLAANDMCMFPSAVTTTDGFALLTPLGYLPINVDGSGREWSLE